MNAIESLARALEGLAKRVRKLETASGLGGSGNVSGPSSSVDGNVVIFDGSTGKIIADSGYAVHSPVTLDADAAVVLDIAGQEIGLDTQTANTVLAGPSSGVADEPTFRTLVEDDIPFNPVTLHPSADVLLGISAGQQLRLDDQTSNVVLAGSAVFGVSGPPTFRALDQSDLPANFISLDTDAAVLLDVSSAGQIGLDTQNANTIFAGPSSGTANEPTFRSAVNADIPTTIGWYNGWISDSNTWTYASPTTFTVNGNVTDLFEKGTRIQLTQTSVKYFYVVSSVYSAPNTTVTITGGSDYSLANAAITATYRSLAERPVGFPFWFNYTAVVSSSSGTITSYSITTAKFATVGSLAFIRGKFTITDNGTGATSLRITYPITYLDDGQIGQGRNMTTGMMLQIVPSGTYLAILQYQNSYPVATGDSVSFSIAYQF